MRGRALAAAATAATVAACLVALAGCGSSGSPARQKRGTQTLTVLAAASLTGTFTELGKRFERDHPATAVRFSFGGSSTLATQIIEGAPADVFASAAQRNMDQVVTAGLARDPVIFARNALQIAVEPGNPKHIERLADLARPGLRVALCEVTVPCGALAAAVLADAKLEVRPVSRESDVKGALAKVELGEVDAALVYVTDVRAAAGKVIGVDVPPGRDATTAYPIAALDGSAQRSLARQFVEFVLSAQGRDVLTAAGFAGP